MRDCPNYPKREKTCNRCGETKIKELFKPKRNTCVECHKLNQKEWYSSRKEELSSRSRAEYASLDPAVRRATVLAQKFKRTPEWFGLLLSSQDEKCAICRSSTPGGKGDWHCDHDHETGEVRGFLCHYCNLGLGVFRDNQRSLSQAIAYLKYPPSRTVPDIEQAHAKPLTERHCSRCVTTKPIVEFVKSRGDKGGYGYWCKPCASEYRQQYYLTHLDRHRENSRLVQRRKRQGNAGGQ